MFLTSFNPYLLLFSLQIGHFHCGQRTVCSPICHTHRPAPVLTDNTINGTYITTKAASNTITFWENCSRTFLGWCHSKLYWKTSTETLNGKRHVIITSAVSGGNPVVCWRSWFWGTTINQSLHSQHTDVRFKGIVRVFWVRWWQTGS